MTLRKALAEARHRARSILSINVFDYQTFRALASSFQSVGRPVMAQFSAKFFDRTTPAEVVAWRKTVGTEIALHLDHCNSVELLIQCTQAGFDSVMYDGSSLPLKDNIRQTLEAKGAIKQVNPDVLFEAEVGHVAGVEDGFGAETGGESTRLEDVLEFFREVEPDLLAVGFGNMHGHYKGTEKFDLELMEAVHRSLPDVLKVLHGGSGMSLSIVEKLVGWGHCKINISSDLKSFWLETSRQILNDPRDSSSPIAATQEMDRRLLVFFKELQEKYKSCLL